MAGNKRKASDSEVVSENEVASQENMGRGKRVKKVNRKLLMSEEDRQKEAARLEKKLAKLRSATTIAEPKQVSLKGSSDRQTGQIQPSSQQPSSNKTKQNEKVAALFKTQGKKPTVKKGKYNFLYFIA